jgi:cell wall-associated NlpC family hydrolase
MPGSDAERLEQLMHDPEFRARFDRDPAGTAKEAGLSQLAEELELGDPMETLEPRESRSSLAGVLMAAAIEGIALYEGGHHLLPPVEDAYAAGGSQHANGGWVFIRSGESFPGNHPNYDRLQGYGASGVLWHTDDPKAAEGIESAHRAGMHAGIWLVPHAGEDPHAFAERAADTIARYRPDKVVLDIESIGKGYAGSTGWHWSDEMMKTFSRLQPAPPPLAVTVEPLQDDFNYAVYTAHGAEVWPQSYLGDMTPRDPGEVVDRVASNGVPRELIVPVLGPRQLDGYSGPHNLYTADDLQGGSVPPGDSPAVGGARPALTPEQIAADRAARGVGGADERAHIAVPESSRATSPGVDPDNVDTPGGDESAAGEQEDVDDDAPAGDRESDDDDQSGDEESDDEEGSDDDEDSEDEEGYDDDQDAPGEGSNGEDAADPEPDGDDSSDGSDSGDDSDGDDSSDSASDGSGDSAESTDLQGVNVEYPGDDAPREDVAAWMAAAAQRRGLPPELPVMAALTESGLRNLSYGDADSIGFFQMRASIWDTGPYSGYGDKPELQLRWFLDHAEAVKSQRLARGLAVDDAHQYGAWIADVENPAAQYRGRYQENFDQARALLSHSHRGAADPLVQAFDAADGPQPGARALIALAEAKKYVGTPYKWGGSAPNTGFDCSGLVQWAYAKAGIRIPRVTDQQILASNGTAIGRRELLPGDLVFFRDSTGYVHHVGISLGSDKFLHAPHTGDVVKVSSLKESYYSHEFAGGRRFDAADTATPIDDEQQARALAAAEQRAQQRAVRFAEAALRADARTVGDSSTALFRALERQERGKGAPG